MYLGFIDMDKINEWVNDKDIRYHNQSHKPNYLYTKYNDQAPVVLLKFIPRLKFTYIPLRYR